MRVQCPEESKINGTDKTVISGKMKMMTAQGASTFRKQVAESRKQFHRRAFMLPYR